jgi:hypothetical protein
MQNEIPAGSKVKVAMTEKGVTTYQDAEVLAHMDGLVHVNLNGDAVSVDPSQIVTGDAPPPATADPALPSAADLDVAAADQAIAEQTNPNKQANTAVAESGAAAAGN